MEFGCLKTNKRRMKEVIFKREHKELIYTTKKIERVFSDDQFKLQELQTHFKCFQECFAMVEVMLILE